MIQVRFATQCKACNKKLPVGEVAYYWPATRTLMCTDCGEIDFQNFLVSKCDEEVYNGVGNPYYG